MFELLIFISLWRFLQYSNIGPRFMQVTGLASFGRDKLINNGRSSSFLSFSISLFFDESVLGVL